MFTIRGWGTAESHVMLERLVPAPIRFEDHAPLPPDVSGVVPGGPTARDEQRLGPVERNLGLGDASEAPKQSCPALEDPAARVGIRVPLFLLVQQAEHSIERGRILYRRQPNRIPCPERLVRTIRHPARRDPGRGRSARHSLAQRYRAGISISLPSRQSCHQASNQRCRSVLRRRAELECPQRVTKRGVDLRTAYVEDRAVPGVPSQERGTNWLLVLQNRRADLNLGSRG